MTGITSTIGYGKANFRSICATYASMKVQPPFTRSSAVTAGKRMGSPVASPVGTWDGAGALISTPVEHPAGTIILLQCK